MEHENEMTYTDHLEELRWKIVSVLIFFVIAFVVSFYFVDNIVLFLREPVSDIKMSLYYFKPFEKFMTYIRISFYIGLFLTIPFGIVQIWNFLRPAFTKKEKRTVEIILMAIPLMFVAGSVFAYKVAAPIALKFFADYSRGDNIIPMWSFADYIELLTGFFIICGIIFETPLLIITLIKIGILKTSYLIRYRRHIIILIAIIAGIFSPPDVVSQMIIGIPMYLLFELSIVIGRLIEKK